MMVNKEILEFIDEHDVKFIRLFFCDPLGNQKNISIMAEELKDAFRHGIAFDPCPIKIFSDINNTDLLLFPDLSSLSLLPWRPQTNSVLRFYCDIKNPDGTDFIADGRNMLRKAVRDLKELGFSCKMGTKCEFYLFHADESNQPTMKPLDNGGYFDISPLDKGENIRREICLCLEDMGLNPESSHHEQGPGQNEIDFKFSDPLSAADNFLTFKAIVKSIATRNGLFASFMPKPFMDKSGSGMHLNISLYKDGVNTLSDHDSENIKYARSFIAGILEKIQEITLFLNPINNSYERFGTFGAPKYISWSHQNRSQLIRKPISSKGNERIELRSPDPTLNPYIAFSLILYAGIYGIENNLELTPSIEANLDVCDEAILKELNTLPKDLSEAINIAKKSSFLKKHINEEYLQSYIKLKEEELLDFQKTSNKEVYYKEHNFEIL